MPAAELETRTFQAESKKLLDIVIHSLYTNKDIFLRELISNASDALDRLRFESLTNKDVLGEDEQLEIRIDANKALRTLTISDNGIGMSRDEVVANIGSIAKSGTRELVDKLAEAKDGPIPPELIGNFGVGFYSAFMVAEKVTLETRRAGSDEAVFWESSADGEYKIGPGERRARGTKVTLELKAVDHEAGIEDFTQDWTIDRIVKRYSDFVTYPIRQKITREEKETAEKGILKPDGKTTIVSGDKTLNSQRPIWSRAESEVKDEEYNDFYRQVAGAWDEPLERLVLKAEGVSEYQSVLFVPQTSPQDLYVYGAEYGLRLYAKRVMIIDQCAELLPRYLRFIKGVVDSADLPLNISRQTLQENRHLAQIRKWLTRKILDALAKLQKDEPEKYKKFWGQFGRAIKEGVSEDHTNKDKVVDLLLFESSAGEEPTTLKDYVSRMKDGQDAIYYVTGESRAMCENSPLIEAFRSKEYEVLFLTDPVDEFVVEYLPELDGKKLQSVAKGEAKLGSEEERKKAEEELKETAESHKGMLDALQGKLDAYVKKVRLSNRLTESPACLAADDHDLSPTMERLMRMSSGADAPVQKRILELNPNHAIVGKLQDRYSKNKDDVLVGDYAELLYGYAALADGAELPDPVKFNKLLAQLMEQAA